MNTPTASLPRSFVQRDPDVPQLLRILGHRRQASWRGSFARARYRRIRWLARLRWSDRRDLRVARLFEEHGTYGDRI